MKMSPLGLTVTLVVLVRILMLSALAIPGNRNRAEKVRDAINCWVFMGGFPSEKETSFED